MLGQAIRQEMRPEVHIINEYELAKIAHELKTRIFNEGQKEKLQRKYQRYLYETEQSLKRGTISEERYLTATCFYLFPVEQLGLPFQEEKRQFLKAMKQQYDHRPDIKIGFSGDEDGWFGANVDKQTLKEEDLIINAKERAKDHIDKRIHEAITQMERSRPETWRVRVADAYGMINITPAYFDHKAEERFKRRYEELAGDLVIGISKPYEI